MSRNSVKIRKSDYLIIIILVVVFGVIIATNVNLAAQSAISQTETVGQTQINSIKSDFDNYITNAKNALIKVSSGAEQILSKESGMSEIEDYIVEQKRLQLAASDGVNFNVYIAGTGWEIIPDFDAPADYHATERNWYVGAVDRKGEVYVSDPYIDQMTGNMCYTLSMMLSDNDTVVAMDFTLLEIQESITKMSLNEGSEAVILTRNGMVVGYRDMSLVGREARKVLPEYSTLLGRVLSSGSGETLKSTVNGKRCTIFYSITENKWVLIVSVQNGALYRTAVQQIVFTAILNLLMLALLVVFYVRSIHSRRKTEEAYVSRVIFVQKLLESLSEPVDNILRVSNEEMPDTGERAAEKIADIKASGIRINEVMQNLSSYNSILADQKKQEEKRRVSDRGDMTKRIRRLRNLIIIGLILVLLISAYFVFDASETVVSDTLYQELEYYAYQFNYWELEQQTVLNMFTDVIVANPELFDDYEGAVAWMDGIVQKYPSISVCYLANPYKEHTVIMNNGWQPEPGWKVEERDWYRDTEKSETGFSISEPYYDEQTDNYCITMSKMVYGENGNFIGIFAIDLYLDKIINVFGEGYSSKEYVFLVDSNGDIINHPNIKYQMSGQSKTNVNDTAYAGAYYGKSKYKIIRDYNGQICMCKFVKDESTGFSIGIISEWLSLYVVIFIFMGIYIVLVLVAIIGIVIMLNRAIRSQADMNLQLKEAVDKATVAGKAKADFLAQMSHEIRTPINAVIGMDEMILRETKEENIREYATDIKSASNTLLSLINGILDFSKIENGKMEIIPGKYNTVDLINQTVNMVSEKVQKKKLEFLLEIDESLPKVLYGDDMRIRQVITNLLSNAVKYTEKGSVTLAVSQKDLTDSECKLCVSVKDTGIGIKKEDMERLFESFQRLDEKRNKNIEGTGLGMSIVQGILGLMGSRLEVKSEYGKGSEFSFEIEQKIIENTPIGVYQKRREIDTASDKTGLVIHDAKILVVDDNEMNLKVVKGLLKRIGITPDLASGGKEALKLAENTFYDMILMDHMMPEMDGIETLKALKTGNLLGNTVVIALTANATSGAKEMYLSYGFKDYLSKPIEPKELENMLKKHLSMKCEFETESADSSKAGLQDDFGKENLLEYLNAKGFNTESAMVYCMDDEDFYREMLESFVSTAAEKKENLSKLFEAKDMKEYQIAVHALKSNARTIGATELSELALSLENACKEENSEAFINGHQPLMEKVDEVTADISGIL